MSNVSQYVIKEVTQSILAILVVCGGGVIASSNDELVTPVVGLVSIILGYYFGRSQNNNGNGHV